MKPWQLIMTVVWVIIIAMLIGVLVLGINGNFPWFGDDWEWPVISFGSMRTNWGSYFDGTVAEGGTATVRAADVTSIEVKWTGGEVSLERYNGSDIKMVQTSRSGSIPDDRKLVYRTDGATLKMREGKDNIIRSNTTTDLVVYVPDDGKVYNLLRLDAVSSAISVSDVKAIDLKIDGVSGSVTIDNVDVSSITVNTVSGAVDVRNTVVTNDMTLDSVSGGVRGSDLTVGGRLSVETVSGGTTLDYTTAYELKANSVSGAIHANGEFTIVDCDTVSGSASVDSAVCPDRVTFNSVSGAQTLTIPDNDGFAAQYDKVSGSFSCDFAVTSEKNKATYKNGGASFKFDTMSGSINIRQK